MPNADAMKCAALEVADLHIALEPDKTLTDCIATASETHKVKDESLRLYLAGVGARALYEEVHPSRSAPRRSAAKKPKDDNYFVIIRELGNKVCARIAREARQKAKGESVKGAKP